MPKGEIGLKDEEGSLPKKEKLENWKELG